jgi:thioredoxin-like negative regulator of GroEL
MTAPATTSRASLAHTSVEPRPAPGGEVGQRTTTERPMLLLFAARTSGQSRRVEGFIAHVLQRRHNHDSFRFRIVLEEERPDLFERFGVEQVPTMVVIDRKQVRRRLDGYVKPHQVEALLQPWLK